MRVAAMEQAIAGVILSPLVVTELSNADARTELAACEQRVLAQVLITIISDVTSESGLQSKSMAQDAVVYSVGEALPP